MSVAFVFSYEVFAGKEKLFLQGWKHIINGAISGSGKKNASQLKGWLMIEEWRSKCDWWWWMIKVIDEKRYSQTQSAGQWRCRAFSRTAVWPCQRDLPGMGHGSRPVRRHKLVQCRPPCKAPGAAGQEQQTKLQQEETLSHWKTLEFIRKALHKSAYLYSWLPVVQQSAKWGAEIFAQHSCRSSNTYDDECWCWLNKSDFTRKKCCFFSSVHVIQYASLSSLLSRE